MNQTAPHYLLYSDVLPRPAADQSLPAADRSDSQPGGPPAPAGRTRGGVWRFVLRSSDGRELLEASDFELMPASRLELLATIRGLEALDQPSRVTLVTSSRYVGGGLRHGLEQWRRTDWQWERFGVMSPIKNRDLWRRLDSALSYHVVECRVRSAAHLTPELSQRFRVERAAAADRRNSPEAPHSVPEAAPADPHWPRRRSGWRRLAASLSAAAAGMGGLAWFST